MISKNEFLTYFVNENKSLSRDNLYIIYEFLITTGTIAEMEYKFSKDYMRSYEFLLDKEINDRIEKTYLQNKVSIDYWYHMIDRDKEVEKNRDRKMLAYFEKKTGMKRDYYSLHHYVEIIIHHLIPISYEKINIYKEKIKLLLKEEEERQNQIKQRAKNKKKVGGVYGMYENGELVYIGMTMRKFEDRWQEHLDNIKDRSTALNFYQYVSNDAKIEFKKLIEIEKLKCNVELTKRDIEAMEFALIYEHQPKYNLAGRTVPYRFSV